MKVDITQNEMHALEHAIGVVGLLIEESEDDDITHKYLPIVERLSGFMCRCITELNRLEDMDVKNWNTNDKK